MTKAWDKSWTQHCTKTVMDLAPCVSHVIVLHQRGLLSFCHCESNFKSLNLQPEWLEHGNEGERRGGIRQAETWRNALSCLFPDATRVWVGAQDRNQLMKVMLGDILKQTKHFETLVSNPNYSSILFKSISKQILTVIFYMALWKLWVWVQPVDETNATLFPTSLKTFQSLEIVVIGR